MRGANYSETYKKNKEILKGVKQKKRKGFTTKIKNEVTEKFKGKCFYCGRKLKEMHIDHLIPITVGGRHTMKNFVLSCPWCNVSKKNMHPISHLWNLHKNEKRISSSALKMLKKCINSEAIGDFVPSAEMWVKSKSKSALSLQKLLEEGKTFESWNQESLERKRIQNEEENTRYKIFMGLIVFTVFLIWLFLFP
jgi:hypothetical protein